MASKSNLSWDEAIQIVLSEHDGAMHYTEIAAQISSRGLKSVANPAASVATTFTKSLIDPQSPFIRIGKGEYALRKQLQDAAAALTTTGAEKISEADTETGALEAFGMFWRRDQVLWSGKPRLWGRQGEGAQNVNFSEQVGVYLLHDRDRVLYVGRAADTLFARLKAHTRDRLGGRWDRFSWFGLRAVTENGELGSPSISWTHAVVIETLEALLIEALEPPLNRKRGDNFSGVEYLQVLEPELVKQRKKQLLDEMYNTIG
jgi:hypothetical protein